MSNFDFKKEDCDGPCVLTASEFKHQDHISGLVKPLEIDGELILSEVRKAWVQGGGVIWYRRPLPDEGPGQRQCLICPYHTIKVLREHSYPISAQLALKILRSC